MPTYDTSRFKSFGIKSDNTTYASDEIPLLETTATDRAEIGRRNEASGSRFEAVWTDSLNHVIAKNCAKGCAWGHSSHRYPFDVSCDVVGTCINFECKHWTRTKNHDHGLYGSRESYGCRNAKKGRQSQLDSAIEYSRNFSQPVIMAVEITGTSRAYLIPCADLHNRLQKAPKMPLEEILNYPYAEMRNGLYEIDLDVVLGLVGDRSA